MRVKTQRDPKWGTTQGLVVERADIDGDIYIVGGILAGFYLSKKDVPALVKALYWAAR